MRFASILTVLLFCVGLSSGQFPNTGSGEQGSPVPPLVGVRQETPHASPEVRLEQRLADLDELIKEAQTLQKEVRASRGQSISVQSFKRSQKIESLAKRIRQNLKY